MKCDYCGRESCLAAFNEFVNATWHDVMMMQSECMKATADRAEKAEAEVRAMQAEAEQWARVGWRNVPEQDAAIATGCNRAAEAILAAKEDER